MKIHLEYNNLKVNVEFENQRILSFLRDYFTPFFEIFEYPCVNPILSVEVHSGVELTPQKEAKSFVVDGSKGFLETFGYYEDDTKEKIRLVPMNVLVEINRDQKIAKIKGREIEQLLVPLLRIIEDIVLIEIERKGGIAIHSSAVEINNFGIAILGNKGAGKTTHLCKLLNEFECKKLTNDISIFYVRDNKIIIRGWPSFYKIELGTIASMPKLTNFFPESRIEILRETDKLWSKDEDKIPFYPKEGAELFDSEIKRSAILKTIIFPEFSLDNIGVVKWNNKNRLEKLLIENLQGSLNNKHPNWHNYNYVDRQKIIVNVENMLDIIYSQISTYDVTWAPELSQLLIKIPELNTKNINLINAKDHNRIDRLKLPKTFKK